MIVIYITALQNEEINLHNQITSNNVDITNLQNEDINLQNQITSNYAEVHNSFVMNCTNVDSSIDNKLTRSSHVSGHLYFHKCVEFSAPNYRHYYIGLIGDNTTNNNQFAIAGDGGLESFYLILI